MVLLVILPVVVRVRVEREAAALPLATEESGELAPVFRRGGCLCGRDGGHGRNERVRLLRLLVATYNVRNI